MQTAVVNTVTNLRGPIKCEEITDYLGDYFYLCGAGKYTATNVMFVSKSEQCLFSQQYQLCEELEHVRILRFLVLY